MLGAVFGAASDAQELLKRTLQAGDVQLGAMARGQDVFPGAGRSHSRRCGVESRLLLTQPSGQLIEPSLRLSQRLRQRHQIVHLLRGIVIVMLGRLSV